MSTAAPPTPPGSPPSDTSAHAGHSHELLLCHPGTGRKLRVPLGYSRSVLLFGPFPLLMRRCWLLALACVALPIVGQVALAGQANRLYLKQLLQKGYRVVATRPGEVTQAEWALGMTLPRYSGPRPPA
ncbi:hypothetical protein [uncultured Sphaerotilus sp.]|uniref:hypothetical protein n=1 Tax=uncultured Sphaerotilus sp. TaxID=474984 RepID=UPI0030CA4C16